MFLQSSESIKSKILTAAMEVDWDYRRYRQARLSKSCELPLSSDMSELQLECPH